MKNYNDHFLVFSQPNDSVRIRLNPIVVKNKLFVVYKGTLRQIKVLNLETKITDNDFYNYHVVLNVKMAGEKDIVELVLDSSPLSSICYLGVVGRKHKFYLSVEDYRNKKNTDILLCEKEQDLCKHYYGEVLWARGSEYNGGYYAYQLAWNGIKPIITKCIFPIEIICDTDGVIHTKNEKVEKVFFGRIAKKTYLSAQECENDNKVDVLYLDDDDDCGANAWKPTKIERLKEWLGKQEMGLDELREIVAQMEQVIN